MSIIDLKSAIEAVAEINRFLSSIQEITEHGTPLKFNDSKMLPAIPDGFERWEAERGKSCPVPDDCDGVAILADGAHPKIEDVAYWSDFPLKHRRVIAYRVTSVPTLTIDDEVDKCWFVFSSGKIDFTLTELKAHYPLVIAGMAYRTREHAETAMKWGLLHDVYYTKMGFERPVI